MKFLLASTLISCLLAMQAHSVFAQAEIRAYGAYYERVGLGAGYTYKKMRFELTGAYRVDHVPASDYISQAHPWPSLTIANEAMQTFSDNTWRENTTILTVRIIRSLKERKHFQLYYGVYIRSAIEHAAPDTEGWNSVDETFMANNRMPISKHVVNVFGGLLLGARGTLYKDLFWDASAGLKLIPLFYQYSKLNYNDGSADRESYSAFGYQYASPWDYVLQAGIGYKF